MKVEFELPDDLYKKFRASLVLNDAQERDVVIMLLKEYIQRLFSRGPAPKEEEVPSPKEPPREPYEENKTARRIPLWAKRPEQMNHRILQCYFLCEQGNEANKNAMRQLFVQNGYGSDWQFENNFASMCTNEGQAHGKVFETAGLFVSLAPKIESMARSYREDFVTEQAAVPQHIVEQLLHDNAREEQRQKFIRWFQGLENAGKPYNPVTISGYTGRIEKACQDPAFATITPKNLFAVTDLVAFQQLKTKIQQCPGYAAYDAKSHNGFTAALNKYEQFLRQRPTFPAATPKGGTTMQHNWSYQDDFVCAKSFLEAYVVRQQTMELNPFAEMLKGRLPEITVNSLRMKIQNNQALCEKYGLHSSLRAKALDQYSKQNERAFLQAKQELGL